jgi:phosphoglycolate phosphatase
MASPLLVFDLDGTLVDSAPDLLATLDAVLGAHGFQNIDHEGARDGIGHGARHLIEFGLGRQGATVSTALLDRMHSDFLAYYESHIADFTRPFPGIPDLLRRFSAAGWSFAVCTNKTEALSRQVLSVLGLAGHFAAVCGGDTFPTRKPHPGHLLRTIAAAGGDPAASVMIGDARPDIDAARGAGVRVIGVTFGYSPQPMAELAPDMLLDDYRDLSVSAARGLLARAAREPVGEAALSLAVS